MEEEPSAIPIAPIEEQPAIRRVTDRRRSVEETSSAQEAKTVRYCFSFHPTLISSLQPSKAEERDVDFAGPRCTFVAVLVDAKHPRFKTDYDSVSVLLEVLFLPLRPFADVTFE